MKTEMIIADQLCQVEIGADVVKISWRHGGKCAVCDAAGVAEAADELFRNYRLSHVEWRHVQEQRWQDSWDTFEIELVKL